MQSEDFANRLMELELKALDGNMSREEVMAEYEDRLMVLQEELEASYE